MAGLLFVTSPNADYKAVNLLLHNLRDWVYSDGDMSFHLVTTKNAYDLELPEGKHMLDSTPPALDSTFYNAWAGDGLKDLEEFCLDIVKSSKNDEVGASLFVVVDDAALAKNEAIIVERAVGEDEDGNFVMLDSFLKMRVPLEETYPVWCNLSVANSDFDEMGERKGESGEEGGEGDEEMEEGGVKLAGEEEAQADDDDDDEVGDGWYRYIPMDSDLSEKAAEKKEKALRRLQDKGLV